MYSKCRKEKVWSVRKKNHLFTLTSILWVPRVYESFFFRCTQSFCSPHWMISCWANFEFPHSIKSMQGLDLVNNTNWILTFGLLSSKKKIYETPDKTQDVVVSVELFPPSKHGHCSITCCLKFLFRVQSLWLYIQRVGLRTAQKWNQNPLSTADLWWHSLGKPLANFVLPYFLFGLVSVLLPRPLACL